MLLQPLVFLLQPPNQRRSCLVLLPPMAGCDAAEASPPLLLPPLARPSLYSPTPLAIPRRRSLTPQRTSEPSYSSTRGHPLPRLTRLRVVPFLGLTVVHRPGALCMVWSTWSRNDFHRKSTVHGEADSWVHGHIPVFFDLPSKSLCQACWAANLSRRGELSFGWPRKWPISNANNKNMGSKKTLIISKWAVNY